MIWLNGTCCTLVGFTFSCLGSGLALDWLSFFFSEDLCAGEAGVAIYSIKQNPRKKTGVCQESEATVGVTFCCTGSGRAGGACLVLGGRSFALRRASGAHFLQGRWPRGRLTLFAKLKFSFCWWLQGNDNLLYYMSKVPK